MHAREMDSLIDELNMVNAKRESIIKRLEDGCVFTLSDKNAHWGTVEYDPRTKFVIITNTATAKSFEFPASLVPALIQGFYAKGLA